MTAILPNKIGAQFPVHNGEPFINIKGHEEKWVISLVNVAPKQGTYL